MLSREVRAALSEQREQFKCFFVFFFRTLCDFVSTQLLTLSLTATVLAILTVYRFGSNLTVWLGTHRYLPIPPPPRPVPNQL